MTRDSLRDDLATQRTGPDARRPARDRLDGQPAELLRLQRLAGNTAVTALLAAQRTCIPGHEGPPLKEGKPHEYFQEFVICDKSDSNCNLPNAFAALRRHAAPGSPGTKPVTTGDKTNVTGLGPVTHSVDETKKRVTNTTDPSHLLHPGKVDLDLQEDDEKITATVRGVGTGRWGRANVLLAPLVWGYQMKKVQDDVKRQGEGKKET